MRPAIGTGRQVKAVPMHGSRFGKVTTDVHANGFPGIHFKCWAEIGLVDAYRRSLHTFEKLRNTALQFQIEYADAIFPFSRVKRRYK